MMNNHQDQELDVRELTELTPYNLDIYKSRGKFKSGGLFVTTHVLESATPLQPWREEVAEATTTQAQ
ncbi:hypothetical protein [Laspinema olomoucense]|jgi:hypothetical protein|uniref:hypothetical protein n=1 Tax=Laspinema olomoucense TaxID=3231600 RepID=UPI0021BA5862|nr:hypothetical protein [Laspinema sp. D3c]MCT7993176.1 hypothetical protein [Laspinema sp. D3c]